MKPFMPILGRYTPGESQDFSGGTILSVCHSFYVRMKREEAEEKLRSIFRSLSPRAMIDHVILGHLKGAIRYNEAVFAISMTREDVLDETANAAWRNLGTLPQGEVTVNLLSVVPVSIGEQELRELTESVLYQES